MCFAAATSLPTRPDGHAHIHILTYIYTAGFVLSCFNTHTHTCAGMPLHPHPQSIIPGRLTRPHP